MKVWYGFGSEHSANIEMIGHFQSVADARQVYQQFERLAEEVNRIVEIGAVPDRFSDEALNLFRELRVHSLQPYELEQFQFENYPKLEGDKIVLRTDEIDVSAFFKLMVSKGAKVQIFSRHHHPSADGVEAE